MTVVKVVLMDLDGTVYRGNELIEGMEEIIDYIRSKGIEVIFFTNNSGKTRKEIVNKLIKLGIECTEDKIVTSGFMAAAFLKKKGVSDVFISGTESLKEEFENQSIKVSNDPQSKTMVIGFDSDYNYLKMAEAINMAIHSDVIIACNKEKIFPCGNNSFCPGCGAMVSVVEYCTGKEVDYIVGKPSTFMFNYVKEKMMIDANEILVIGDSYESDIIMAKNCGAKSLLSSYNDEKCITNITVEDISLLL